MERFLAGVFAAAFLVILSVPASAASSSSDGSSHTDRHPFTLSTMMCVGNGCPERTYAYHRCDSGYIWSARTHKCVRRVKIEVKDQHSPQ